MKGDHGEHWLPEFKNKNKLMVGIFLNIYMPQISNAT
jgi:hypothetical protein